MSTFVRWLLYKEEKLEHHACFNVFRPIIYRIQMKKGRLGYSVLSM